MPPRMPERSKKFIDFLVVVSIPGIVNKLYSSKTFDFEDPFSRL